MEALKSQTEYPKPTEVEKEISKEQIERLPNYQEPPCFYRGLSAKDAFKSLFGYLELCSKPEHDPIGERDNATLYDRDAIAFAPTSIDKKGKQFLCAIGFDPVDKIETLPSRLGRTNQLRINGKIRATEVIIRPAGKKQGKPGRTKFLSPKEFYNWYIENIDLGV
ncbi:MAG: hypothetical protein A3A94_00335 [Candidatus Portnoybacteria bacterium RIFCSPLOWO2_01_FULL_43_11]|uniref:Uncharacterized protein n=4 Tax=Candidatus Portnoyibacteriota TaxID=1817913 RepID=A0A1G2FEN4_9BACT|nr:MAG: hypothetical protein A2815_00095 [Candidatus Portnoybacteria bacterium RIFCSPHIGHO2_01_FULL_40_12b]OGZ37369.1 MAG: hypothetical protein A3D38_01510 [Candidatus Portnoybacteria bacterium RIFCSPHIGHO2_02_FULL_40_23]OGZ38165.1 MAG: hypothetical protein A3A94_00335 [Candidatus Portnoybacteria bacterium RIFCSPLOWO2_01_FULL_43_11]OGZ38220.1 MAG: hypothetical protein A3E90_02255 [Candidatus Portnoybacteria bacterium RIFCSPHIGHO2_12_FULL_40_11]OGZ40333.1 MAG: hypothetical protein A3I20_00210 [C